MEVEPSLPPPPHGLSWPQLTRHGQRHPAPHAMGSPSCDSCPHGHHLQDRNTHTHPTTLPRTSHPRLRAARTPP
eukprot:scaffold13631_cov84-Isochrysis_galbana.AAC.2